MKLSAAKVYLKENMNVDHDSDEAAYSRSVRSWLAMMRRCIDPLDPAWKHYGARGIGVCGRWYDVRNFLADMGRRPRGLTLDRIDNNGHYEPGNCRWANSITQARNTRRARLYVVGGIEMNQCVAAAQLGVSDATLYRRAQAGLPVDKKRFQKLSDEQAAAILAEPQATAKALARRYGVSHQMIYRIRSGQAHKGAA